MKHLFSILFALGMALAVSANLVERAECSTECADYIKAVEPCKDKSVVLGQNNDCTCQQHVFEALAKCGNCQAYQYAPYTGALKGFMEIAIGECAQAGFTIQLDTSKLPSAIEILPEFQMSDKTIEDLVQCTDICNSVCDKEQVDTFDKSCVCTQKFLDSQFDCTACAMTATNNTDIENQVLKESKVVLDRCSNEGIKGLKLPSSIKPQPIQALKADVTNSTSSALPAATSVKTNSGVETEKSAEAIDNEDVKNEDSQSAATNKKNTQSDLTQLLGGAERKVAFTSGFTTLCILAGVVVSFF